jgi:AraC-like DNA-binding protein
MAKLVARRDVHQEVLSHAIQALHLTVNSVAQDCYTAFLAAENRALRRIVETLGRVDHAFTLTPQGLGKEHGAARVPANGLVERALEYIAAHHADTTLNLEQIAAALQVNARYLTHLFSQVVGQRMRAYITVLRVQHGCHMLLATDKQVKQIAHESGFGGPDHFSRVFRGMVGVPPAQYRRVFAERLPNRMLREERPGTSPTRGTASSPAARRRGAKPIRTPRPNRRGIVRSLDESSEHAPPKTAAAPVEAAARAAAAPEHD